MTTSFFDSSIFTWVILPLLIFLARICDMTLDTMRIIMIGQGRKAFAAFFGFFEVAIWLLVARQVIMHLPNPVCFFAFAGGFAAGNYVGMSIEERLASVARIIRVIVSHEGTQIIEAFTRNGFGYTSVPGQGSQGPVNMLFTIVDRRRVKEVIDLIKTIDPKAFYTVEDIRDVSDGVFPSDQPRGLMRLLHRE